MILATAAVVVSVGYLVWFETKLARAAATIATSATESRTKMLPDGSVITLAASTQVQIDFRDGKRHVHLLEGEVGITAVPHATKAFEVTTDLAKASTMRATFRVAFNTSMTVEVYDGIVDVAAPGRPSTNVKKGFRYRINEPRHRALIALERDQVSTLESIAQNTHTPLNTRSDRST